MKVLVPCAGGSSRFPNMPPKWMLPDHDQIPMVLRAIQGLRISPQDVIITFLREHEVRFQATRGLMRAFGAGVECVILEEPTSSQSETIAETLKRTGINEPFLVKDSDNFFEIDPINETFNYVTVSSLNEFDLINARNKSYVQVDQDDIITNIREKNVISDLFSVGGYFFRSPSGFLEAFRELKDGGRIRETELYISEIIGYMILNGGAFKAKRAKRYQDWGTVIEWRKELERRRVFLVSIDGFLFERGSAHFSPNFSEVVPNPEAIAATLKMLDRQNSLIYLTIRPRDLEKLTKEQLKSNGLPDGPIIFDCGVGPWALVTSSHASLPFNTSRAYEIDPHDINIAERLDLSS